MILTALAGCSARSAETTNQPLAAADAGGADAARDALAGYPQCHIDPTSPHCDGMMFGGNGYGILCAVDPVTHVPLALPPGCNGMGLGPATNATDEPFCCPR